jgi:hypothetical protein
MKADTSRSPGERDIAYFVDLHLDTVAILQADRKEKHWIYTVVGKPRPMVVMRRLPGRERGRVWFRVLRITSKGLDEQGRLLPDMQRIGRCIDPDRESFVKLEALKLPENMLSAMDGSSSVHQPCDPLSFGNAVKVLQFKMLRAQQEASRLSSPGQMSGGS